jgi:hypothetical protein
MREACHIGSNCSSADYTPKMCFEGYELAKIVRSRARFLDVGNGYPRRDKGRTSPGRHAVLLQPVAQHALGFCHIFSFVAIKLGLDSGEYDSLPRRPYLANQTVRRLRDCQVARLALESGVNATWIGTLPYQFERRNSHFGRVLSQLYHPIGYISSLWAWVIQCATSSRDGVWLTIWCWSLTCINLSCRF